MDIFVAEGLDNEIALEVLQQPFEALPPTALYFVKSCNPNGRLISKDHASLSCIFEQNLRC